MRLDIDVPNPLNSKAEVFLNGEKVKYCLVADEEKGYIVRNKLNEKGLVYFDAYSPDEFAKETVHGHVEIKVLK